jgi:hypothetical protein
MTHQKVTMDPAQLDELTHWFELSRSGDQELITPAEQAVYDRIRSDPTYPSFLLSAAQLHHRYARHCLTLYGWCGEANRGATDLPGDLNNVPFLEVISILIAAGEDVGSLVAKPLVTVWLATERQYPPFEQALLHYRDDISWLPVTISLVRCTIGRYPAWEFALQGFADHIPELVALTFEHADRLVPDAIALFFIFLPEGEVGELGESWTGGFELILAFARECPRRQFERLWLFLATLDDDIAQPFYPIARDFLFHATIDDVDCEAALLYFVAQHSFFISDFEGEWKPLMLRMFDTEVRLPDVDPDLLPTISVGRNLDLNGAVEFIGEVLTELAGNVAFHPTVLATLWSLSQVFPEFPVFQTDFFEPLVFGTLRNSEDPTALVLASCLIEEAINAYPSVDARALLGQLCDGINPLNVEYIVELISPLLAAATNDPRNVLFCELCGRLQSFVDAGLMAYGIYALALSLLDPLCWISESEIASLTGLIREYAAVFPIQVAILIIVLFQRAPGRFANDVGEAVAVLVENCDDLPDGFWCYIMDGTAKFLGVELALVFEPLLLRLFDVVKAGNASQARIKSIYRVLARGSRVLPEFCGWLLGRYRDDDMRDLVLTQAIVGALVVLVKTRQPGNWLLNLVDETLELLPEFLEFPSLYRTVARFFRAAFKRIPDPETRPALLGQPLSEHFAALEKLTAPFIVVDGAAKFALSLIRFPALGMTTWFLNWIVGLCQNSDNDVYPKALLRFLRSAIRESARLPDFPLPDFPLAECLGALFHRTDWQSQMRAGVYAVLRSLIPRDPACVRELAMEEPLEQMTPLRAFCIVGLVALGHLSIGDDVLIDLLPYLERIQPKYVHGALLTIENCRKFAHSRDFAVRATHVQCRLVMMVFGPDVRGLGTSPRISAAVVNSFRQGLAVKRTQPEIIGPLVQLWEGEEGRLNDFLNALVGQ